MELDPVIHVPTRLRLIVSLSELAPKDTLTFARLQDLQEKVKLMTETINWMDEEIMEHGDEPALLD